jgi:hypothetical protein
MQSLVGLNMLRNIQLSHWLPTNKLNFISVTIVNKSWQEQGNGDSGVSIQQLN